jgi:type III pantothenate kinase
MILALDIGNSHTCGGIFNGNDLLFQFRYDTNKITTSDEFGVFLRNVFHENGIVYSKIKKIGISSVVPSVDYTVRATCIKYLNNIEPSIIRANNQQIIKIFNRTLPELGADLIAGSIAACDLYPQQDVTVFDLGTASTACYINAKREIIGVAIAPGFRLMMESLHSNTAKLTATNITIPKTAIGTTTNTALQTGIYYTQLGFINQIVNNIKKEYDLPSLITIATGGYCGLLDKQKIFDAVIPELVLLGIKKFVEFDK